MYSGHGAVALDLSRCYKTLSSNLIIVTMVFFPGKLTVNTLWSRCRLCTSQDCRPFFPAMSLLEVSPKNIPRLGNLEPKVSYISSLSNRFSVIINFE